jgi:hypothetical protein
VVGIEVRGRCKIQYFLESKSISKIEVGQKMFSNMTRIRQPEAGPFVAVIYVRLCSFPAALSVAGDLAQPVRGQPV